MTHVIEGLGVIYPEGTFRYGLPRPRSTYFTRPEPEPEPTYVPPPISAPDPFITPDPVDVTDLFKPDPDIVIEPAGGGPDVFVPDIPMPPPPLPPPEEPEVVLIPEPDVAPPPEELPPPGEAPGEAPSTEIVWDEAKPPPGEIPWGTYVPAGETGGATNGAPPVDVDTTIYFTPTDTGGVPGAIAAAAVPGGFALPGALLLLGGLAVLWFANR